MRQRLARGEDIEAVPESSPAPLFKDFAEHWFRVYVMSNNKHSEIRNKRAMITSSLIPFFGRFILDQISAQKIEEYKSAKMKADFKNKTINNHLSCLRKCLNTAQEWGTIEQVPRIRLLKVPPPETFFLSPPECNALLAMADGTWREMILIVLRTGLRFGELAALRWEDLDLERRILTIQRSIVKGKLGSTKGNKIRKIPLASDVVDAFERKVRDGSYVFTSGTGASLRHETCRARIRALAKLAGLRPIGWHTLRHTFASHLANNGIAIQVIQSLLGHSDIKTTMRYAHLAPATLVEAIKALPMYAGQVTSQERHKSHSSSNLVATNLPLERHKIALLS